MLLTLEIPAPRSAEELQPGPSRRNLPMVRLRRTGMDQDGEEDDTTIMEEEGDQEDLIRQVRSPTNSMPMVRLRRDSGEQQEEEESLEQGRMSRNLRFGKL